MADIHVTTIILAAPYVMAYAGTSPTFPHHPSGPYSRLSLNHHTIALILTLPLPFLADDNEAPRPCLVLAHLDHFPNDDVPSHSSKPNTVHVLL